MGEGGRGSKGSKRLFNSLAKTDKLSCQRPRKRDLELTISDAINDA